MYKTTIFSLLAALFAFSFGPFLGFQTSLPVSASSAIVHTASAQPPPEARRFEPWLDALEQLLISSRDENQAAEKLLAAEKIRDSAFRLEALGRVYADWDKGFKDILKETKALEDALGDAEKWQAVGNEKNFATTKRKLAQVLKDGKWFGGNKSQAINKIRKFVEDYTWRSPKEDKSYVTKRIEKQLRAVNETKYNFSHLEQGNGLHPLRRQLRWVLLETQSLDGLIQFRSGDSCSLDAYAKLPKDKIAQNKHSTLPDTVLSIEPCRVSKCLFLGVSQAVKVLGDLKDEAELKVANIGSDNVPADLRDQAEKFYASMSRSGLLPALIQEVHDCR